MFTMQVKSKMVPESCNLSRQLEKKDSKGSVVLPYIKNKADKMKRIFKKHKINVCFKPYRTLRQMLVRPKDKTDKSEICGPVYKISCEGHEK